MGLKGGIVKVSKKKLQKYWDELQLIEDWYVKEIAFLEADMEKETGVEGIEFFWSDGYCGIGTVDRSMKLVQFA